METIPEEEEDKDPQMAEEQAVDDLDMVTHTSDESEEEPFNMAIDDTSEEPTIVMGKPVTTAFVSDDVCIPTEKVGCLQVTSQLQEFLNHFPPESKEKAFEQIYQILQMLDVYLINNPQQHQYCMLPDSEYISLIMYATKHEIDLCNFLAIWEVLSILLDTQSNELQYVKNLQQVVDDYCNMCPMEVMSRLEHQITDIMNAMYDSATKTPYEVSTSGTGKNAKVDGLEGTKKGKPPYKKATKDIQIKKSHKKGEKAEMLIKAIWIHFWVIRWLILQHV